MTGTVFVSGGFNGATLGHASDQLGARIAAADAQYEREARAAERERKQRVALREEELVRSSIEAALARGEVFNVRQAYRDGGVGHTKDDFVALCSAEMDPEDARAAARQRKAFEAWQLQRSADYSADTSAPHPLDVAEKEAMQARAAEYRATRRERGRTVQAARTLARMDRGA